MRSTAQLDLDSLVTEERDARHRHELRAVDALREGIAAVSEVVVAEDDDAPWQIGEKPLEERKAGASRHEVAGDDDEIRTALHDPGDRALRRTLSPRRDPEMEVGEVGDSEAVERLGHTRELDLEHPAAEPPRLEPSPGEREKRCDS